MPPICGKCGYDLTGLPLRGGCPECGNTYDQDRDIGMGHAMTPEDRGQRIALWLKVIGLVVCAMGVMSCSGLLSMLATNPKKPLMTGGAISILLLVIALGIFVLDRLDQNENG